MNLGAQKSQMAVLTRNLALQWETTKESWKDAKRVEFEQRYMEQLLLLMERAGDICDRLDTLTSKVRNDCE